MVTLITEQLRKQSLEEPYHKAFSFNATVSLPTVGSSPTISWRESGLIQEATSVTSSSTYDVPNLCEPEATSSHSELPTSKQKAAFTPVATQSSPPPPSKRHCRSLSVPEDLSRCRSTWHPSASKVWTPVKHDCFSRGALSSVSAASSLLLCGTSSSFTSSSIHSSSSPTFFSLALSSDSPLSWGFPWDASDTLNTSASLAMPSSCSSSPAPLSHAVLKRRFSLSPVHIQSTSVTSYQPSPLTHSFSSLEQPAISPSSSSACSTPSSLRRDLKPVLPRCHSQPCDMRRPRLKRRHDPDVPCPRPGLDFSKMTQISSHESMVLGSGGCTFPMSSQADQRFVFSPAEFLGRVSIGPLSESEEDDEIEGQKKNVIDVGTKTFFERDCTELDLTLIEEN